MIRSAAATSPQVENSSEELAAVAYSLMRDHMQSLVVAMDLPCGSSTLIAYKEASESFTCAAGQVRAGLLLVCVHARVCV